VYKCGLLFKSYLHVVKLLEQLATVEAVHKLYMLEAQEGIVSTSMHALVSNI